jgi:hypothetical protein
MCLAAGQRHASQIQKKRGVSKDFGGDKTLPAMKNGQERCCSPVLAILQETKKSY